MYATKTMTRNNLVEKTLNNLMHHLPLVRRRTLVFRELQEFVDACMARWDSSADRRRTMTT
jgi:hypothetical protein